MSDAPSQYRYGMILRTPAGETLLYPFADVGPAWSIAGRVPLPTWLPLARGLLFVGLFVMFSGWEFDLYWLSVAGLVSMGMSGVATAVALRRFYQANGPCGLVASARVRARTHSVHYLRLWAYGGGGVALLVGVLALCLPPPMPSDCLIILLFGGRAFAAFLMLSVQARPSST